MIVVNATAAKHGGALSILRSTIKEAAESEDYFVFFICDEVFFDFELPDNVKVHGVSKQGWIKRIVWDLIGLKLTLKKMNIKPRVLLSLQNTSVNVDCQQFIYIHQPLIIFDGKLEFTKDNVILFLYKYFYQFFVFLFKADGFIVQADWIKEGLVNKFNIKSSIIHVTYPEVDPAFYENSYTGCNLSRKVLFFPASVISYKNHAVILKAMLDSRLSDCDFKVTFCRGDNQPFDNFVDKNGLIDRIYYLGYLSGDDLVAEYKSSYCLVFPSYVETFGLPLLESALMGLPIIASDLPYSRSVLTGYGKVIFSSFDNSSSWVQSILAIDSLPGISTDSFKPNLSSRTTLQILE